MKNIFLLVLLFGLFDISYVLCQSENIQFPTFADPPGPENVLVVYNENSATSVNIMLHYMDVRNIPFSTHKVPIDFPPLVFLKIIS